MPEDNPPLQNQPNSQSSDVANKMIRRIGIFIGVLVVFAILAVLVVLVIVAVDPADRFADEKSQPKTQASSSAKTTTAAKLTYSIPEVEGYQKELAPSSKDRDLYAYMPAADELKKVVSNVNFIIYRSSNPKKQVLEEMELSAKDKKQISLEGTDFAYSGCAAEATEGGYKYKHDYEACAISFCKGDIVVLVEARAALDIREQATKETGDKLLAEAQKIAAAFLTAVN